MGLALEPLQRSKAYVQSDKETGYKTKTIRKERAEPRETVSQIWDCK